MDNLLENMEQRIKRLESIINHVENRGSSSTSSNLDLDSLKNLKLSDISSLSNQTIDKYIDLLYYDSIDVLSKKLFIDEIKSEPTIFNKPVTSNECKNIKKDAKVDFIEMEKHDEQNVERKVIVEEKLIELQDVEKPIPVYSNNSDHQVSVKDIHQCSTEILVKPTKRTEKFVTVVSPMTPKRRSNMKLASKKKKKIVKRAESMGGEIQSTKVAPADSSTDIIKTKCTFSEKLKKRIFGSLNENNNKQNTKWNIVEDHSHDTEKENQLKTHYPLKENDQIIEKELDSDDEMLNNCGPTPESMSFAFRRSIWERRSLGPGFKYQPAK